MKTLVYGAGPLGCLYTHLLGQAGKDVTILARGQRYDFIKAHGLILVNEHTGNRECSKVRVVDELQGGEDYDLVVVLIRKNKLGPVFDVLRKKTKIENILFMGNNALGFDEYLHHLPKERVLFGFPGAGGGISENTVHYVDREKAGGKRKPITIGELDGETKERTRSIRSLFETSRVPVNSTRNIDGWLKYHVAMVSPMANALYMHDCDNYALAQDKKTIKVMIHAAKEGGKVLADLGYTKRFPFQFNLFFWLPAVLNVMVVQHLLESKFAEVGFALHARAARDEMGELAAEFQSLINKTSIETPNIDRLRSFIT